MRLLVAEDDPKLCDVLARGLEHAGYVLDVAHRGDDALELLRYNDYAAAIIDWRMPGMDGVEMITVARRQGLRTPMLILTARDAPADRIAGLDAGGDDYLVKPFNFEELLARIRALLRRPVTASESLHFGRLIIDPARREARVDTSSLALTPTEYVLLDLLVRRAPLFVSRRDLMSHAWPRTDEPISANAIEVHMARLRAKLAPHGCAVEGMRRSGYRLTER
ncbi:MAG: response regulator transcription factor [Candidatus Dormibacteria bacterium]